MPQVIGHRGAAGTHPENTMASFQRAFEIGVDGIEFDVHRTADGHLVVIHDPNVDRTTDGSGLVMAMTLAEIQALDAGSWKDPAFAGQRVPTLRELVRATPPGVRLYLELKAGSVHYPGIEEEVVALLKAEGVLERTQISSFDHRALVRFKEICPELPLGMLTSCNLVDPVGMAKSIGCEAIHPAWPWVTPDYVAAAHAAGLKVNCWTADDPMAIAMMKAAGVDGIISNYPERVKDG
ncbi:glycerophosphoryl diester phosphodiesterase [Symbiobacterium terraclitae]|uniref:Glycerophosphoryl diester phosphodiesterase n=1 Tax=Symbiobacterium terraclitae TaxID=557451 RepID=A0ABS4JRS6_9FIRM|nr:glycerophosphodiester phosphodiesterase [Symbiobacterium terraclitae]MBP2018236.1 glycerophosphoryl diester phosphodiesterase [Symbiobacterium terraclitae]